MASFVIGINRDTFKNFDYEDAYNEYAAVYKLIIENLPVMEKLQQKEELQRKEKECNTYIFINRTWRSFGSFGNSSIYIRGT